MVVRRDNYVRHIFRVVFIILEYYFELFGYRNAQAVRAGRKPGQDGRIKNLSVYNFKNRREFYERAMNVAENDRV